MLWQFLVGFPEERLALRTPPSQIEEPNRTARERELSPDQALHPEPVDREHMGEQRDSTLLIRPAEADQLAARGGVGLSC